MPTLNVLHWVLENVMFKYWHYHHKSCYNGKHYQLRHLQSAQTGIMKRFFIKLRFNFVDVTVTQIIPVLQVKECMCTKLEWKFLIVAGKFNRKCTFNGLSNAVKFRSVTFVCMLSFFAAAFPKPLLRRRTRKPFKRNRNQSSVVKKCRRCYTDY